MTHKREVAYISGAITHDPHYTDINYDMAIALADNLRGIAEMYLEEQK